MLTVKKRKILKKIGIWDEIDQSVKAPFTQMRVVDYNNQPVFNIRNIDYKDDYIGTFIDNQEVINKLIKKVKSLKNCRILAQSKASYLIEDDYHITVKLDNQEVTSRLIIGADGPHSWVRKQGHFRIQENDHEQQCFVGICEFEKNHQKTAWQKFLPEGTLGFLPLTNNLTLAFSTDNFELYNQLDDKQFIEMIEKNAPFSWGKIVNLKI